MNEYNKDWDTAVLPSPLHSERWNQNCCKCYWIYKHIEQFHIQS